MIVFNTETRRVSEETPRIPEVHESAWIHLQAPKTDVVKQVLQDMFHCHPLLVEDCIKLNQRPKLDQYKSNALITFFSISKKFTPLEIGIVIGRNYIITVSHATIPFMDDIKQQLLLSEQPGKMDSGNVLYRILDRCVDEYNLTINHISEKINTMEQQIYDNPNIKIAQEIFHLRRTVHRLWTLFSDESSIISNINHVKFEYTGQEAEVYFLDIIDHLMRVIRSLDIYRESVRGLLELQMSMKSDRMNEIMKTLTVLSSIFLPLTFLVGVYGMNFAHMPELQWKFGYLYIWIIMILCAGGMWMYFKSKKWL